MTFEEELELYELLELDADGEVDPDFDPATQEILLNWIYIIYSWFQCKVYLNVYVNLSFRSNFDLYKLFYENKNIFIVHLP